MKLLGLLVTKPIYFSNHSPDQRKEEEEVKCSQPPAGCDEIDGANLAPGEPFEGLLLIGEVAPVRDASRPEAICSHVRDVKRENLP